MTKSLAASQKVMKNYLSELLTEQPSDVVEKDAEDEHLEKLLQGVSSTKPQVKLDNLSRKKSAVVNPVKESRPVKALVEPPKAMPAQEEVKSYQPTVSADINVISTKKTQDEKSVKLEKSYRKGQFQAMFFDVAGLLVAVPLIDLGGIHQVDKINSLVGKPNWFKGVMVHREEKINVVDTALWVMPDKCDEKLINSLNYQYVIMLNNSKWGLMAENLVDTVVLEQDEVKWLDKPSKRPWLAGLVKKRMCALLDVEALIKLLDAGAGIFPNK